MWIIVVIWGLLVLWKCEYSQGADLQPFSKENALVLKGVCAIEIVIGHMGIATGSIYLFPNRKSGILFVGIFFALSGYGLMYSVTNKPGYLDNLLRKRLPKIVVPAYMIYAIGMLIKCTVQRDMSLLNRLISLPEIFAGINWYIWEIVALYVVFYIAARVGDIRKTHWWILVISLIFIFVAFILKIDNPWYGSTLCFWLGIVYFLRRIGLKNGAWKRTCA